MSLINDALRRANQQNKTAPPPPSDGAPMQAVQQSPPRTVSFFGPMLLIFLLGVVLTCAGWFFWKSFTAKPTEVSTTQPPANPPAPVSETFATPVVTPPPVAAPAVVAVEPAAPPAAVVSNAPVLAETPPAPPALKLQGIFFRVSSPTALVSGKTVGVGETVQNARVVKIERQSVTLERDGERIILELR